MKKRQFPSVSGRLHWGAVQIAGLYLLIGCLWIVFSDKVAAKIALNEKVFTTISLYKGWAYVLVTALMLYWLIRRHTSALQAGEKQLQRVIDALPSLISYVNREQRYEFTNKAYTEWFGQVARGKKIEELLGAVAYKRISKYIDNALKGEFVTYDTEIAYQDGTVRFVNAIYVPDIGTNGQVKGFFALVQDVTERKQVEEEHRLWADAFEGCAQGIAIVDPNTNRIVVCNPAFASLHKMRVEDIVGSAILSLYAPFDQEHVRRNVQRADQIGHSSFEARMIRKDSSTFPVQMDVVSVLGDDGDLLYRVLTAQNISERKAIDEKLKESETRYRTLVEHLPAITYTSEPGQYVGVSYISPQIEALGFKREIWLADPEFWLRQIHPDDREEVSNKLKQFEVNDEPFRAEYRLRLPNGEIRWFHDESIRVKDPSGKVILKQGFMIDMTDRERAEEKVLYQARLLAEVNDAVIASDENLILTLWNPAAERIYGWKPEEVIGKREEDVLKTEFHKQTRAEAMEALKVQGESSAEVTHFRKDGTQIQVEVRTVAMYDEHRNITGYVSVNRDITERKQAERMQQLERARWQGIVEGIADEVWTCDAEGKMSLLNLASITAMGLDVFKDKSVEEVYQEVDIFYPDGQPRPLEQAPLLRSLHGEIVRGEEIMRHRQTGKSRYRQFSSAPTRNASGAITGAVAIVRDITEQKTAEEGLRRFELLSEHSRDIILFIEHKDGRILEANAAAVQAYGYSREELLALTVWDLRAKDTQDLTADQMAQADAEGILFETIHRRKDSTTFPVEVSSQGATFGGVRALISIIRDITERKRIEEQLERSNQKLNEILDSIQDDFYVLDRNWIFVFASRSFTSKIGKEPKDFIGQKIWEMFPKHVGTAFEENLRAAMEKGETRRFEITGKYTDAWYRMTAFPSIEGITVLGTDITERKRAEEQLRKSEERYRLIAENSNDWIYWIKPDQNFQYVSPSCERVTGFAPQEFMNDPHLFINIIHPEDQERVEPHLEEVREGGETHNLDYRILTKTNEVRWISHTCEPVYTPDGKYIGRNGTNRDITERKQAQEALQKAHDELELKVEERTVALSQANSLLQALMDHMPDHIYFKDTQSRFIRNSKSQASSLGLSDPVQAVGKTDFDFFPHAAKAYAEEQEVMRSGQPLVDFEEWVVWPDGHETWVSTTKVPLRDAEGKTIGIFGISRDITERKKNEQNIRELNANLEKQAAELQAANKELEAFSYSVSHDLRAPLRAIDGYTRILVEDYEAILDREGKRVCGIISAEARRMGQLIDDLLAFSRLGRKQMYTSKIDMSAMVTSVFEELTKDEERERIDFQVAKLHPVKGDSSLIRQVWINLLSNAIKFTSKKERATIEVGNKQTPEENIYYVCDNGAGFDMEYANKLFGVFQRLHSESEFDGTGVGLAIVQRIIRRHGGHVWAKGEVEKGATFYFALPRKENIHE